jgi:hypothetical protein
MGAQDIRKARRRPENFLKKVRGKTIFIRLHPCLNDTNILPMFSRYAISLTFLCQKIIEYLSMLYVLLYIHTASFLKLNYN